MSSQAELHIGENDEEDYFTGEKERILGDFWNFFQSLLNLFEVDVDQEVYQMLKEKKEKNWLLSIIKFMRDKLKELIKKIFARDLSFNQRLDKEIKELQEKLGSGELSEEEFARALERLTALQNLKLRLQMAVVGWIVTMFAEMFGVELAAIVEASAEKEDKKAEKTSLEATKEVRKDVEIKVDEREKPAVPVSLFDVSSGFVRPVVLSKPELEIVSDPLKHLLRLTELERKSHENSQKLKVDKEEKNAKPEEPRKEVCPPKPTGQPATNRMKSDSKLRENVGFDARRPSNINGRGSEFNNGKKNESASCAESRLNGNVNEKGIKSINKQETDDPYAKFKKKVAQRNNQRKEFADNGKSSASAASDAKENPRSKITDVLNECAARENGNAPSRSC
ncbi:hypothetical protein [Wolbachia endosymbiont (group A) of Anomoia purmunda]|nr:hypothetical protein [Wolbachia endosymbiont (group A) of Anomoia purmunda]